MRIGRTLPPAAAPIYLRDVISGLKGLLRGQAEINRFESEISAYFGVKHAFLVSSGKAALYLILKALKDIHPERDEVLIPAYTCYSVPSSIVRAGLKVKLCDINPKTLDFDFNELAKLLDHPEKPETRHLKPESRTMPTTREPDSLSSLNYELSATIDEQSPTSHQLSACPSSRLLAIIPIHLFGLPANISKLRSLIGDPQITIIEDAAQTLGGEWDGRKLGTGGDVGFFSIGRGKALSAVEGGIILTKDSEIADRIRSLLDQLPNYGCIGLFRLIFYSMILTLFLHPSHFWIPKAFPFLRLGETIYDPEFKVKKMSPFQAGLTKGWQDKLKIFRKNRALYTKEWTKILFSVKTEHSLTGAVTHNPQPATCNPQFPDLLRFPVVITDDALRKRILEESERYGLGIMPGYPDSIDHIEELRNGFKGLAFPSSTETAKMLITLPLHPFLTGDDVVKIASLISSTVRVKLAG